MSSESSDNAVECLTGAGKIRYTKVIAWCVAGLAVSAALFHLFTVAFGLMELYSQRLISLSLLQALGILAYPLGRKSWRDKINWFFAIDALLLAITLGVTLYTLVNYEDLTFWRLGALNTTDIILITLMVITLLEFTRRAVGWILVIICASFLVQALFGEFMPGWLSGANVRWNVLAEILFVQPSGILGTPMMVVASYLIVFMIMVAFLNRSGGGEVFIDVAMSISGKYAGGAAKVAVIGSGLVGTFQGSHTSNVATTGTFTIPMMKSLGFKPHMAGAVEAMASTGGQIMPPVMGLTAFLIAEFLGITYFQVCIAAVIPALLYYITAFFAVHFYAKRNGLVGAPPERIPKFKNALLNSWSVVIPILLLIYLLGRGYSIGLAGLYCTLAIFALAMLKKSMRWTPTRLLAALEEGGRSGCLIAAACASAGIIIGTFTASGLGDRLSQFILATSGGHLWIALIITGLVGMLLSMGMPTSAVYITMLMTVIPALIKMGAPPLSAHFFAFWYGNLAGITPPFALSAYVAAGIAGAGIMRTAVQASLLGLPLFVVPYFFPYFDGYLAQGPVINIVHIFISASVGCMAISASTMGYFLRKSNWAERVVLFAGGFALLSPFWMAEIAGVVALGLVALWQAAANRREKAGGVARVSG